MGKTHKTNLARSSRVRAHELELERKALVAQGQTAWVHPHGDEISATWREVERGGVRHGNNRKYYAGVKVKGRRSDRQKSKRKLGEE